MGTSVVEFTSNPNHGEKNIRLAKVIETAKKTTF